MSVLDFPEELYDFIFDEVCSNPKDYLQYRMVCKTWLFYTTLKAFRITIINNDVADAFASISINPSSILSDCVHHLILDVDDVWLRRLLPCLQPFRRVEALELRSLSWPSVPLPIRLRLTSIFRHCLRRLVLGAGLSLGSFEEAQDLMYDFPALEELSIDGIIWNPYTTSPGAQLPEDFIAPRGLSANTESRAFPEGVRAVHIGQPVIKPFFSWIMSQKILPQVHLYSIANATLQDFVHLHSFFSLAQIHTRIISIAFHSTTSAQAVCPFTDAELHSMACADGERFLYLPSPLTMLERCPPPNPFLLEKPAEPLRSLQTFRIDNFIRYEDHARTSALFFAPNVLSWLYQKSKTTELRKIILCVHLRRVGEVDLHNIHWCMIDRLLIDLVETAPTQEQLFEGGKQQAHGSGMIAFEITGGVDFEALGELIRTRLPKCARAGSLTFSKYDSSWNWQ
ncbi:hypothetical protein CPB83DRAFT_907282 [Crepidotus variabilis]|uniref:F-box domain-containing protein n=1 Tax=Crepidotus variabilis TaxID=179855 RepID=A0A9P6EFQ9_9AGAR|nr:hypothetical protein CPB83DRAFT_907282 [Crepidotus variabilis]